MILSIRVRFDRSRGVNPGLAAGYPDGRLTKSVTGGSRSSGRRQARRVRGAGATADNRLRRPTQNNTSPAPGRVQHADNTDETALSGTRRHTCKAAAASS